MTTDFEEKAADRAPEISEEHNNIKLLSNKLDELMKEKDRRARELKDLEKVILEVNDTLLNLMKEQDVQNFKTPRGTFYIRNSVYASVKDADPAFEWLKEKGLDGIIKPTVHTKTLSSEIKRLLGEGELDLFSLEQHGISAYIKTQVAVLGRNKQ